MEPAGRQPRLVFTDLASAIVGFPGLPVWLGARGEDLVFQPAKAGYLRRQHGERVGQGDGSQSFHCREQGFLVRSRRHYRAAVGGRFERRAARR